MQNKDMENTQQQATSRFGYDAHGTFVDLATGLPPTEADHIAGDAAYTAMFKADGAFQAALVKRYKGRAGDMRYKTNELPADLRALAMSYQLAVDAWRATWFSPEVR